MKMAKTQKNEIKFNQSTGITLIALVITIIILLILAGVAIASLTGDNGLLNRAVQAKDKTTEGQVKDEVGVAYNSAQIDVLRDSTLDIKDALEDELPGSTVKKNGENLEVTYKGYVVTINTTTGSITAVADNTDPNAKMTVAQAKSSGTIFDNETTLIDDFNNEIIVPKGFKISVDSGTNVKVGIVVDDGEGNQYVWIPVSNINHDGSNKIKLESDQETEITLGRYTFDDTTGIELTTQGTYQYGVNYSEQVKLSNNYLELVEYRQSNEMGDTTGTNTTSKNLQGFIESVRDNKGYYIARYEASYRENGKAGSKISTSSAATLELYSAPASRETGELWNFINQREAATACQELYTTINSDLINSYAWDTAIIYIQAMGNSNYANRSSANYSIANTGTTNDEVCKINDMASNTSEYSTEYCEYTGMDSDTMKLYAAPCTLRGGCYSMGLRASTRDKVRANNNFNWELTFRPILYVK